MSEYDRARDELADLPLNLRYWDWPGVDAEYQGPLHPDALKLPVISSEQYHEAERAHKLLEQARARA